jgi:hypothetical protein
MDLKMKRRAEYWREVMKDFIKSGKRANVYVREHNLCRGTFYEWRKRLGFSTGRNHSLAHEELPPLSFIEVAPSKALEGSAPLLRCEIAFSQGHTLKLEMQATCEQAGNFLKTLMG